MEQNVYQRATALWVAQKTGKDADMISNVNFRVVYGGYCETCGYEAAGIEYRYGTEYCTYEFGYDESMATFLEEAVELMASLNGGT